MAEIDLKERLVELIRNAHKKCKAKKTCHECEQYGNGSDCVYAFMADDLIAHSVTVQEWIPASDPPTLKDADKYGRVLAMEMGMMALVNYKGLINYPDRFPYWMPLPQPPKGE